MILRYEHCTGFMVGEFECDIEYTRIVQVIDRSAIFDDEDDDDDVTPEDGVREIYRGSMLGHRQGFEVVQYVARGLDMFCKLLEREEGSVVDFCVGYAEDGPIFWQRGSVHDT